MNIYNNSMSKEDDLKSDKFHDECGVFGVFNCKDASTLVTLGLHALQHRGQEACGIVSTDFTKNEFNIHKAFGHVADNFNDNSIFDRLQGNYAIGHVRYSTHGKKFLQNAQPICAETSIGSIAIAHNGNITNANELRQELIQEGCIFQSSMDTEVLLHLITRDSAVTIEERIINSIQHIRGAYSLIILANHKIIALRDPYGIRPLVLGKLNNGYILSSETCGFDIVGGEYIRDIEPNEMLVLDAKNKKMVIKNLFDLSSKPRPKKFCVFEHIYFARPDSLVNGQYVYNIRHRIGIELARIDEKEQLDIDIVVPVPDSGNVAAIGYSSYSGKPFELGIIRNHYVGRTFIEPSDSIRHFGVKLKHNANRSILEGKNIVLIDDSIVRGTTSKKIISMLRNTGVKEIHMRIASPPTKYSCFYGIDTPDSKELIVNRYENLDEIADYIGVTSLKYIPISSLYNAVSNAHTDEMDEGGRGYCDACFTGNYVEL